nr:minor core protein [Homalodisca vitripennis reovirus]
MGDDAYCIPNFSQTIDKRVILNVFEACRHRSPIAIIGLPHRDVAVKYSSKLSTGSGTIVYFLHDSTNITNDLFSVFRAVGTQLLMGCQIVIFVTIPTTKLTLNTLKSIGWAFRAAVADFRDTSREDPNLKDFMDTTLDLAPLFNVPKCGIAYYGPTIFSELLELTNKGLLKTKWYATIDYSMFSRSAITAFAAYMLKAAGIDRKSMKAAVVGYNPPYVWTGLKHGLQVKYLELHVRSPGGLGPRRLILPKLDFKDEPNKVKYVVHNPQIKLLCHDMTFLSISRNVLYIGSYPATHLEGLNLYGWKLLCVDPKNTPEWAEIMRKKTNADITQIGLPYDFTTPGVFPKYVKKVFGNERFVVMDDSWIDGRAEYEDFQLLKQSYFESVCASDDQMILASVKWHRTKDTTVKYLLALLPQPYGGSIRELRAVFSKHGVSSITIKSSDTEAYLDKFNKMSQSSQIYTQAFMHQLLTTTKDALEYDVPNDTALIASYSLSNSNNSKSRVLQCLDNYAKMKKVIIFGAPNLLRLKFMKEIGLMLDSSIKIKDDLISFSNPSGKKWVDRGYTAEEMQSVGFIEITVEQMVSLCGGDYAGCGYFVNSSYNDIFSWYIPMWMVGKLMLQDIRTSPSALVKCFTTVIRSLCFVPHRVYYAYRSYMVAKHLAANNVLNTAYTLIGSSDATFIVNSNFSIPHPAGPLNFTAGDKVNISGHLLSLSIAAHFVAAPILLWAHQMKYMTQNRKKDPKIDPLLYFDNKLDKQGSLMQWHSREEVLLACLIVEDYVSMMFNGNYSKNIINDITATMAKVFKA